MESLIVEREAGTSVQAGSLRYVLYAPLPYAIPEILYPDYSTDLGSLCVR